LNPEVASWRLPGLALFGPHALAARFRRSVTHLTVRRGRGAHDGIHRLTIGGTAMDQAKRLKWSATAFTVFWIGGMLWWSGEHHPANIIILTICGTIAGYLWYLAMRWVFQHMCLLSPNGDHGAGGETP
jgi:hypothetical protein